MSSWHRYKANRFKINEMVINIMFFFHEDQHYVPSQIVLNW